MKRRKQYTKELERTAYHEAGHAVAAYHLLRGRDSGDITIIPGRDHFGGEDYLGCVLPDSAGNYISTLDAYYDLCRVFRPHLFLVHKPSMTERRITRRRITRAVLRLERKAVIVLAGDAAESRFTQKDKWKWAKQNLKTLIGISSDLNSVIDYVNLLSIARGTQGPENEILYFDSLWTRAKALFDLPELWAAVEALVKVLLICERMDGTFTWVTIREAIDDYYAASKARRVKGRSQNNEHPEDEIISLPAGPLSRRRSGRRDRPRCEESQTPDHRAGLTNH